MPYDPRLAIADRHLSAEQLQEKYTTQKDGGEHPAFSLQHWRRVVSMGATLMGYWSWVVFCLEEEIY